MQEKNHLYTYTIFMCINGCFVAYKYNCNSLDKIIIFHTLKNWACQFCHGEHMQYVHNLTLVVLSQLYKVHVLIISY